MVSVAEKTVKYAKDVDKFVNVVNEGEKAVKAVDKAESVIKTRPSQILSRNIARATGDVRQAGEAAHHIVPYAAKAGEEARSILKGFDIGINSAVNGVHLAKAFHSAVHTKAYYEAVTDALRAAGTREEAVDALHNIGQQLLSGRRW